MFLRLFLALVFVVYAFAAPVNAACVSGEGTSAAGCCCCAYTDTGTCTISGSCCPSGPEGDAVPAQAFRYYPHSAFVITACIAQLPIEFQHQFMVARIHSDPVNLASNKLYLKKRA
jgi:hypothetical protein